MKTGRINNSNSFIPVILYKEQQAGPRQLTAQLYHLRDISKPLASRAWDSPRDFVRDIFWSSSSLLSPQNQNPWAMPCQASSNPPGSRGSCSKTPTSASSADTCGMLAGHTSLEPASLPGLAWSCLCLDSQSHHCWSFLALFRTDMEQGRNKTKQKKRRTHIYSPKRSNSALPEHTFWGQGSRGPSCYLRPVMLKHSQRHWSFW